MESLKMMKQSLMAAAQSQMGNLSEVDAEELGEVIDMIKDLEEAIYYCTITKAMEEKDQEPSSYMEGRMYYDAMNSSDRSGNVSGNKYYHEREMYPQETMHDEREGRSPIKRRMYMESKEMHQDKAMKMSKLETYAKELYDDVVEMMSGASPEEKQMLHQKLVALSNAILNG